MDNDNVENLIEYLNEIRNPIHHTSINMGIKDFKKVARSTDLSKTAQNKLIRAYKRRSWMEWSGITRFRGTFPTHPKYGKEVEIEMIESEYALKGKQWITNT